MLLKRLVANPSLLLIPSISVQSNARNIEILWDKMLRRIKWFALTLTIDDLHSNAIFPTVIIPYSIRVRCKPESLAKSKSCLNDNFQWVWITANLISEPLSLGSGDLCQALNSVLVFHNGSCCYSNNFRSRNPRWRLTEGDPSLFSLPGPAPYFFFVGRLRKGN